MNGFDTLLSGLGASCLCAAPVVAIAAFDVDESRPLRSGLNWLAAGLFAFAVATAFLS